MLKKLLKPSLDWLLVFVPVTAHLHFFRPDEHVLIFVSACLAILPLAGWLGRATEHLAEHTGEGSLPRSTHRSTWPLYWRGRRVRRYWYPVVQRSDNPVVI